MSMRSVRAPAEATYTLTTDESFEWRLDDASGNAFRTRLFRECRRRLDADGRIYAVEIREPDGRLVEIIAREGTIQRRIRPRTFAVK